MINNRYATKELSMEEHPDWKIGEFHYGQAIKTKITGDKKLHVIFHNALCDSYLCVEKLGDGYLSQYFYKKALIPFDEIARQPNLFKESSDQVQAYTIPDCSKIPIHESYYLERQIKNHDLLGPSPETLENNKKSVEVYLQKQKELERPFNYNDVYISPSALADLRNWKLPQPDEETIKAGKWLHEQIELQKAKILKNACLNLGIPKNVLTGKDNG